MMRFLVIDDDGVAELGITGVDGQSVVDIFLDGIVGLLGGAQVGSVGTLTT